MSKQKIQLILGIMCCVISGSGIAAEAEETAVNIRQQAVAYEHGRNGVKQDYRQAFTLYCQAALKGDAESADNMGFMYFNGRGLVRDLGLAMYWFKQAAEGGVWHAKNMLKTFREVVPVVDNACKPVEPTINFALEANSDKQQVAGWVSLLAHQYGIDPLLVMAVIQVESGFNPEALSTKNAQGLMQLIPETAQRFGVKDIWNPQQNIKGGIAYLHWLLRHFEGKVDWVLAAYNAGEGAVEKYKGIPPYQETQNYVKLIQARYSKALHPIPPEFVK
jgi:soluble lytic murein transglycosylase-like protein